ncbi:MAG: FtsX-like permease family protein [Deltaproteobacteria bacterium]|nr:MAG: FtsX-like permease family protein [Deltaproteobacteria bacterium]
MHALARELRLTLRRLIRDPALAGIAVIAFALGIGLTASMYSIAYAVLFRGLPVSDPDALFFLTQTNQETGGYSRMSPFLDYLDLREQQTSFDDLGAYSTFDRNLADDTDRPERIPAAYVTPNLFSTLGIAPALGRGLEDAEIGPGHPVVLISDALWRNRYAADPSTLGRTIRADGDPYTIVGVMPPRFDFPAQQELWFPFPWDRGSLKRAEGQVSVVGRLRHGVAKSAAESEMTSIVTALAREFADTNQPASVHAEPLSNMFVGDEERTILGAMIVSSFFVLLIACANVANLLMARATGRSRQFAIATALGASRRRLLSGLLLEAAILAVTGGVVGVVLGNVFVSWFARAIALMGAPMWLAFKMDLPILLFTLGISAVAALMAGLMPAWRASAVSVHEVLQDESRGASSLRTGRWSQAMVVTGITLAFPLLVGAGLMIRSVAESSSGRAFATDGILAVRLQLPGRLYQDGDARQAFWDELLEWADRAPGVTEATYASALPGAGTSTQRVGIEGGVYLRDVDRPSVRVAGVRPGFFALLGVQPTAGRVVEPSDLDGPPVAVINRPFADRYFPDIDPLGRHVATQELFGPVNRTVVGVVPDLLMGGDSQRIPEGLYVPAVPGTMGGGYLLVKAQGDPLSLAPGLRAQIARIDPDQPVSKLATLDDFILETFWLIKVLGSIFTAFGLSALFLAAVGLYGVMANSVTQRTREMGVRRALGAEGHHILALVLAAGLRQVVLGMALGGGAGAPGVPIHGGGAIPRAAPGPSHLRNRLSGAPERRAGGDPGVGRPRHPHGSGGGATPGVTGLFPTPIGPA